MRVISIGRLAVTPTFLPKASRASRDGAIERERRAVYDNSVKVSMLFLRALTYVSIFNVLFVLTVPTPKRLRAGRYKKNEKF